MTESKGADIKTPDTCIPNITRRVVTSDGENPPGSQLDISHLRRRNKNEAAKARLIRRGKKRVVVRYTELPWYIEAFS